MERRPKPTQNSPVLFPTYEASRKAIKQLLKIDENSLEELELLAEDEPQSGWFAPSDTESVVKVEEGEAVPRKDMRRINEENQKATILIDEAPKKTQPQAQRQSQTQAQRQCTRSLLRDDSQRTFSRMSQDQNREEEAENSIIEALATELTNAHKQEENNYNFDESIVSPVTLRTREDTESRPFKTNPQVFANFSQQQQTLISRNPHPNAKSPIKRLFSEQDKPRLIIQMRSSPPIHQQINRKKGPKEQETIDLDSDSEEDLQPSVVPPRQTRNKFGSSSMLSILSRNLPSLSLQRADPTSVLNAHKKKMQKKIKNARKEFMKTITIQARRMIVNSNSGNYEYLWCFGADINCWKPLHDIDSLYELYLCQAKLHRAAVLNYLPAQLDTDMPYLIYKIQSSPSLTQQQQEISIERTLYNRLKALEVCKYFHEALLLKALEYNRWCERMEHQSIQNSLRQTTVRPAKRRTVFVDLEEEQAKHSDTSGKSIKNGPKIEAELSRRFENTLLHFRKFK